MSKAMNRPEDTFSNAETEARQEAALQRMFATPHKPYEPIGTRRRVESEKSA